MTRFLPDGQAIRKEVIRIFKSEKGRRVALVAFVGKSAEAYLPRPKGIELVCWPHAPGTNPSTIEFLMNKRKVDVRFARRLHMKVYWTATQGAVVASANLSMNAYGAGALHEAGVLLDSSKVDIDALLSAVKPQTVTATALEKLKRETTRTQGDLDYPREKKTFLAWLRDAKRKPWLLHCFDAYGGSASQRLKTAAKKETGSAKVEDFVYCRKGEVKPEDFVLCVDLASKRKPLVDRWLFAHRVVLVGADDKRYNNEWPFQAGQFYRAAACPPPPFNIDGRFRRAVRMAYEDLAARVGKKFSVDRTRRPDKELLSLLGKHYTATTVR